MSGTECGSAVVTGHHAYDTTPFADGRVFTTDDMCGGETTDSDLSTNTINPISKSESACFRIWKQLVLDFPSQTKLENFVLV